MTPPPIVIPFVKASACGNDFIIIEGEHAPADLSAFTRRICDRHEGVGADGVEWLFPTHDADIRASLINADGSEAEISGNGTRCVAAYLASKLHKEQIVILTGAGPKTCTMTSHSDTRFEFEIAMGEPQVDQEFSITIASGQQVHGIPVSMGNPHFVVFVEGFSATWQADAAAIGRSPVFKHGVNIEFVRLRDKHEIDVRFYERGVGETQSSGTGSCASAVAAIAVRKARSPIRVLTPGGVQAVRWDQQVYLRGNAQLICRGEFFV
jgi:diaminopimelate epimerase